MLKMLVVDDEYFVRLGIKETIVWEDHGIEVVGEASNGKEGLDKAKNLSPDIIITDIRMPFLNGLEFMAGLKEQNIHAKIIILSGYNEFEYARAAIKNDAIGYLLKPIKNCELIEMVNKAADTIYKEREKNYLYDKLKSEKEQMEKQFFRDWIYGNIPGKETFLQRMEFFGIRLKSYYTVLIKVDEYELFINSLGKKKQQNFSYKVTKSIEDYLKRLRSLYYFIDTKPGEWLIILDGYSETEISKIEEFLNGLLEVLAFISPRIVSIGVSSHSTSHEDLPIKYEEALKATEIKHIPGVNTINITGRDIENNYRGEVNSILNYIKANYYKQITVDMVSKELYISTSHLMYLMKKELGRTFNDCLREVRIEMAKKLLKDPEIKVYEVAELVGYTDVKYFSRVFKRVTGVNPSDYARLNVKI